MAFDSGSKTTNIRLGTCKIRYKGVDLGYTMGGVEVEVATTTHETKVDQFGDIVANEFIMGRSIVVRAPMAEVTLANMVRIMPGASLVATGGGRATGTITIGTNPASNETITINGHVITFKTGSANPNLSQVLIGADTATTAENLKDVINQGVDDLLANLEATRSSNIVTVKYTLYSAEGNAVTLVDGTTGDITLSGATLAGGSAPTKQKVEVKTGNGVSLLDLAGELSLHPIALADNDVSEDLVIPLAATPGAMNFAYKYDEERVFNAEFKGYPDDNGVLFIYGDKTAVGA